MHVFWDGNGGSSREWGKTSRRRRFGYFGGGELETTNLGSGIGMHPSVYPYSDDFWSLVRTMCSSRTGGWSLPCVMSD
jgi:hypothetical protein